MKTPPVVTITMSCIRREKYRARVSGWGVTDAGGYGSVFSLDLPIEAPRGATPAEVLHALYEALGELTLDVRTKSG